MSKHDGGQAMVAEQPAGVDDMIRRRRQTTSVEVDQGERLLRFLGRLSRFGLAADAEPLLRPAKPGP